MTPSASWIKVKTDFNINLVFSEVIMCLSEMKRGQTAFIDNIPDDHLRAQLMRFGITAGTQVLCHTRIPFGPVVLRYGGQEIALGRDLALQIKVKS